MNELYKETMCAGCGSKKRPLFMRMPPRDVEDVWCKDCQSKGVHINER